MFLLLFLPLLKSKGLYAKKYLKEPCDALGRKEYNG